MDLSHIAATDNAVRPVIEIVATIRYYAKPIRADFGPGSIPIQRLWRPERHRRARCGKPTVLIFVGEYRAPVPSAVLCRVS